MKYLLSITLLVLTGCASSSSMGTLDDGWLGNEWQYGSNEGAEPSEPSEPSEPEGKPDHTY